MSGEEGDGHSRQGEQHELRHAVMKKQSCSGIYRELRVAGMKSICVVGRDVRQER